MTSPQHDFQVRIAELLGTHDIHPEDREEIQQAFAQAETWEDLPEEIREKIVELEQEPLQTWDDPSDVPEDLDGQ